MELALKAALTATLVTLLVLAAQWLGEQAAGLISGLPLTTVPAVLLAGNSRGAAAAADVAAGGAVGCALACVFAFSYHRASRRLSPRSALLVGVSVLAVAIGLAHVAQPSMSAGSALALVLGVLAFVAIGRTPASVGSALAPRVTAADKAARRLTRRSAGWALTAGAMSAGIATLALVFRPSVAGMLAAMPLVAMASVAMKHAAHGRGSVTPYLRGYVTGSLLRAAFCSLFALLAVRFGVCVALLAALGFSLGGVWLGWFSTCHFRSRKAAEPYSTEPMSCM